MDRNLSIEVPYDLRLQVETKDGDIEYEGVGPAVSLSTASGNIRIRSAWRAMRLRALCPVEPKVVAPRGLKLSKGWTLQEPKHWMLSDNKSALDIAYGTVFVRMAAKSTLELIDAPFPNESPVKPPWVAAGEVEAFLKSAKNRPAPRETTPAPATGESPAGDVVFRSDVRLVNLSISIKDDSGKPVAGLAASDFEVLEDNVPQKVDFAGAEEVSANVAFLIDLSGSTQTQRTVLKDAVTRFLGILRPKDKAALYAIANDLFYVLSRLSPERQAIQGVLDRLGRVSGGSPVYDSIWLAYAEELKARPGERNALIVISDGLDNQIDQSGTGSEVSYKKLRDALALADLLIYPVVLDPFTLGPAPSRNTTASRRMEELAEITGGRTFPSKSLEAMAPVITQVGEELRSLYTVAYRPSNQEFRGEWRKVEVRLKKPGLKLRSRSGYVAR
jgi:Ca-activated chloride channel family protein